MESYKYKKSLKTSTKMFLIYKKGGGETPRCMFIVLQLKDHKTFWRARKYTLRHIVLGGEKAILVENVLTNCFLMFYIILRESSNEVPKRCFTYEKQYFETHTSHHTCLETNDFLRCRSITINHQQVNST